MHWIFVHYQSDSDGIKIGTSVEYLIDSAACLCCFLVSENYCGAMANLMITWSNSHVQKVNALSKRFIRRHKLPYEISYRLEQCLSTNQLGGSSEVLAEESGLFSALPEKLQEDLHYLVRARMKQALPLFTDMS